MLRTWAVWAILATSVPVFATQKVSVAELERILAESKSLTDADLAAKLADLQLTERLNSPTLSKWRGSLAGPRSQRSLLALGDRAAFLAPPASEIPSAPTPDMAEQRRIMGLAANYVTQAIPQLPRFLATRTTTHFEADPQTESDSKTAEGDNLRPTHISRAMVAYREGQEVVEPGVTKVQNATARDRGLRAWGAFGPILSLVLLDAAQSELEWKRWEKGGSGNVAVFSYRVSQPKSHYEVRYCCVASSYGFETEEFKANTAYHGEITVDPEKGTILRLTIDAEIAPDEPISRASMAVEYGPQDLGGVTYICPTSSVSVSVAKTLKKMQDPSGRSWTTMGPSQLLLNDVVFDQYHLFRSETRVLSKNEELAAGLAPDATLAAAKTPDAQPAEEDLAQPAGTRPVESGAVAQVVQSQDENAEISTAPATKLPDSPAQTQSAPRPSGFTLRVSSHLVDVNVVALDKKGRPIPDLKPEDFEVYDNGVKQEIRSFTRAATDAQGQPAGAEHAAGQIEFSNLRQKKANTGPAEGNTIILLVDAGNLAYGDLADARQQILHFLKTLNGTEQVALYVSRYHRFEILQEPTSDHALVEKRLASWRPNSQDVGNANDEEQRNRQLIETVHSPEDMLSVNGNFTMDTSTQSEALDAKLREMGSNAGPNSLSILVDVAHHLAVIPGHKSLIWVTSDNALADWNKLSITIEKGSKYIEPVALRTQEAMNNAHVSVYPLDASRLEASVVTAEIGRRNVELTPTFQKPPYLEHEQEGPETQAGQDMNPYTRNHDFNNPGRLSAQMQQDLHAIQGVFREVAEATGGRALRRTNNMIGELNGVVAEGHATYLLEFAPTQPPDGKYHVLTVKLAGKHDAALRFRSGYKYDKEPTTMKERFSQAIWEATDASEIAVSAKPVTDAAGSALRVTVAGADLDLAEQSASHTGKLDIFLVRRDEEGLKAKVSGQTVGLKLKPTTYQRALNEGLTFDERLDGKPEHGSLRVVVVDVNSGRIGSVTVPSSALESRP